jgi:hypothetical protein
VYKQSRVSRAKPDLPCLNHGESTVLTVRRPRVLLAVLTLALAVAACSGTTGTSDPSQPAGSGGDSVATTSPVPDDTSAPGTTEPGEGTTETTSDRPLAPDFTLELGDGGSYTLSEGEKPVYLVFWAEW